MKKLCLLTLVSFSAWGLEIRMRSIDSVQIQDQLGTGHLFSATFNSGGQKAIVSTFNSPEFLLSHCISLGRQMLESPEKYDTFIISGGGKDNIIEPLGSCSLTRKPPKR